MKKLFRPAALNAQRIDWLGGIVLIRPVSFLALTMCALACAALVLGFLLVGSYTKHSTVSGQLTPDIGLVKVYAPQSGVIIEKNISEGDTVKRGQVLYLLSTERQGTEGDIQASISRQVRARHQSLQDEVLHTQTLHQSERDALDKRVASLRTEMASIAVLISGQRSRLQLADDATKRAELMLGQGYVSKEMMQQKLADLLDQRNRLQTLERDSIGVERELQSQRAERVNLALRQQNQLAQIIRTLGSTNQEWTESESKRRVAITAPESGIVTAVTTTVGQTVDNGRPLASIVPSGAILQAELYAQSKSIGFIKPADPVRLRYQAYPYQKFGHAHGIVAFVSKVALPPGEFGPMVTAQMSNGEPLYRITVILPKQTIDAYGHAQSLQAGMLVEADILQEKRKLYEWVLEPLYSVTGKL